MWPENWPIWLLWQEMSGQWRVGMNGAYAIDYGCLFARMERMRLSDQRWEEVFHDFRVVESAALDQMRKA